MPRREYTGPTVERSRFRGPGEPYVGHWRKSPASWQSPEQQLPAGEMPLQVADALARLSDHQAGPPTRRRAEK
jgi:RNA polymerase sigma-70 factor (ECF subfamily)